MNENEIKQAFGYLQAQVWQLEIRVAAMRIGLAVLARNHHDLPALLQDFDREVETTIAHYLTTDLKEELLDKARRELEEMRNYLRGVVEQRQQQ